MKKTTIALGLGALMAVGFSACDTYDIYPEQYAKVMSIKNAGDRNITVWSTDPSVSDTIIVMKGGHKPDEASSVQLRFFTDSDWAKYMQETNNTALRRLPANVYSFNEDRDDLDNAYAHDINFEGGGVRYSVHRLYVFTEELRKWELEMPLRKDSIEQGLILPIVPVVLSTTDVAGDTVSAENNYVFLHPTIADPMLGLDQKGLNIKTVTIQDLVDADGNHQYYEPELKLDLPSQLLWDVRVRLNYLKDINMKTEAFRAAHPGSESWELMDSTWFKFDEEKYPYIETIWAKKSNGEIYGLSGAYYQLYPSDSEITFGAEADRLYKGRKDLPLGIKIDLGMYKEWSEDARPNHEAKINTNYVIPLALIKNPTFNNPLLSDQENKELAEAVGLKCNNTDTLFIGFKVEKVYSLQTVDINTENAAELVTSNFTEPNEGSIEALFDDDPSTFWHSTWSSSATASATYHVYLEFTIPAEYGEVNMVGFDWTNRSGGARSPETVTVWAKNDTEDWWKVETRESVNEEFGATSGAQGTIGDARHPFISVDSKTGDRKPFNKVRLSFDKVNGSILSSVGSDKCVNCAEIRLNVGISD